MAKLLRQQGLNMPKNMMFQFDNCAENKVSVIFFHLYYKTDKLHFNKTEPVHVFLLFFVSRAVFFDEIQANFLIVGHTHSSNDQYFSVLTRAIKNSHFIASPLSLMELLKISHKIEAISKRPSIVRSLTVYYDIKTALQPYISKKIKVAIMIYVMIQLYLYLNYNK